MIIMVLMERISTQLGNVKNVLKIYQYSLQKNII